MKTAPTPGGSGGRFVMPRFGRLMNTPRGNAGTVAATVLGLLMQSHGAMAEDWFSKRDASGEPTAVTPSKAEKAWPGVRISADTAEALSGIRSITGPDDWYTGIEGAIAGENHAVTLTLMDARPLRSSQISLGKGPNRLTVDYQKDSSLTDTHHPSLLDIFSVNGRADEIILNEGPYVMTVQADRLDRIALVGTGWRKDDEFSSVSMAETAFTNEAGGTVTVQWADCARITLDGEPVDCYDKPLE